MKIKCDKCSSPNVIKFGFKLLKDGDFQRYQCKDCRHVFYIRRKHE